MPYSGMNSVPLCHDKDNIDKFSREQPVSPMVNENSDCSLH